MKCPVLKQEVISVVSPLFDSSELLCLTKVMHQWSNGLRWSLLLMEKLIFSWLSHRQR